jgi:hypothetical protein
MALDAGEEKKPKPTQYWILPQYCVGFEIYLLRQAVLGQGTSGDAGEEKRANPT